MRFIRQNGGVRQFCQLLSSPSQKVPQHQLVLPVTPFILFHISNYNLCKNLLTSSQNLSILHLVHHSRPLNYVIIFHLYTSLFVTLPLTAVHSSSPILLFPSKVCTFVNIFIIWPFETSYHCTLFSYFLNLFIYFAVENFPHRNSLTSTIWTCFNCILMDA